MKYSLTIARRKAYFIFLIIRLIDSLNKWFRWNWMSFYFHCWKSCCLLKKRFNLKLPSFSINANSYLRFYYCFFIYFLIADLLICTIKRLKKKHVVSTRNTNKHMLIEFLIRYATNITLHKGGMKMI